MHWFLEEEKTGLIYRKIPHQFTIYVISIYIYIEPFYVMLTWLLILLHWSRSLLYILYSGLTFEVQMQNFFRVHLDLFFWSASWFIAPKTVTPCRLSRLLHLKPQMFLPLSEVTLEMRLQTSKKIIPAT